MKKTLFFILLLILLSILTFYLTRPLEPETKLVSISVYPSIKPQDTKTYLGGKPVDIVFFFQGLGTDILASFPNGGLDLASGKKIYRGDLVFFSFDYNNHLHWTSPKAVLETMKVMNHIIKSFNTRKVKIIGISMGGALALDILSKADKDLKNKITDALIVYPVIDYEYTLFHTKRKNIREQLIKHFFFYKDPFKLMKESSPITFYQSISKNTKITIIEGLYDTHVCSNQIEKYFAKIKLINKNTKLLQWEVDHLLVDVSDKYKDLVLSILN